MPAKPKAKPPTPATHVEVAGSQSLFLEAGAALAVKLGWEGKDDWEQNDITVADARGFIVKTMHEHFQAAALGQPQPDHQAACEHLAVDTPAEQTAIGEALKAAFDAGKGAEITLHERRAVDLGNANLVMDEESAKRIGKAVS